MIYINYLRKLKYTYDNINKIKNINDLLVPQTLTNEFQYYIYTYVYVNIFYNGLGAAPPSTIIACPVI